MNFSPRARALAFCSLAWLAGCTHAEIARAPVEPARPVVAAPRPVAPPKAPEPEVAIETAPSTSLVSADGSEIFVRVRVTGLALANAERAPLNLALVVDTSGSMDGDAIANARRAAATLVDLMHDGDALSIVTFGSKTRVVVPAVKIDAASREKAKRAIDGIVAEGTTDMDGGLRAGLEQVRTFARADGISRIVLVGDGVPNDPTQIPALADAANGQHVSITTLGLGPDFDETIMTTIAQRSQGAFHFVDDASLVAKVFEKEISKLERVVGRGGWVEITPGPGVVLEAAIGLPGQPIGRSLRVSLGDISEGQTRDIVVRVKLPAHRSASKVEILDATIHAARATTNEQMVVSTFLGAPASSDAKAITDAANLEVEHEASRLVVADDLVRAIALARQGDVKGARKLLDEAAALAKKDGHRFDDPELAAKEAEARKLKKTVASLAPPPPPPVFVGAEFGGPRAPTPKLMDVPRAMSPAAALELRGIHGEAMREIQGN
jgi:Ca-activated chloride channel family protein